MALLRFLHIMMTVWKVYCLVTFFSEEDEYENEDKYNLEHDTSDEDSCMSDKDVDNELETFDGFVDSLVYGISKGESMDLVALGNFDMKKKHAVYPYDHLESYHAEPHKSINIEDMEKQCCEKTDVMDSPSLISSSDIKFSLSSLLILIYGLDWSYG